jgi:hypothetical protein
MGNMCPLSCTDLDDYVKKALELKCPNVVIPLLKNHRAMLYYPNPQIITNMFKFHEVNKDWEAMKKLYNAIAKK